MSFARFRYCFVGLLTCLACNILQAATYNVPGQFPTIQAAIDDTGVVAGDEIIVAANIWTGNIELKSGITLQGAETARTFLRSTNSNPVVRISGLANVTLRGFTFTDGSTGISIVDSTNIKIENNVFNMGTQSTAIDVANDLIVSTARVAHNTFVGNDTAIRRASDQTTIKNNIFNSNDTNVDPDTDADNISFNCFAAIADVIGSNEAVGNPSFVNTNVRDFHLQSGSPCIDAGDPAETDNDDAFNATDPDAGAYGGKFADTQPFPLDRPTATLEDAVTSGLFNITLNWTANLSYLNTGYEVHYDSDQSGEPYTGTDAQSADVGGATPSPIDVPGGATDDYKLFNLLSNPAVPDAPVLQSLGPSNRSLELRWSAVPGTTAYRIEYGIAAVTENSITVGNVTQFEIHGLQNGETYRARVTALGQTTYYFSVKVVGTPATAKSAFSPERSIAVGAPLAGTPSNELSGIPESVIPFPALPDQGDAGCFIATAAYGHYSHPQVQVLRDFRDRYLLTHSPGRIFVRWYYRHSPAAAAIIAQHETLRMLVRWALLPMIAASYLLLHTPALLKILILMLCAIVASGIAARSRLRFHRNTVTGY